MHPGGKMSQKNRIAILELMKQPGNNTCADCGTPNPEWASASKGLFICITCSGIHRNLRDHSKSLRLDTWTDEKLKFMEEHGNEKGNAIWAKKVPLCYRRPKPTDPRVLREQWIRAKYEREEFIDGAPQPSYLSGSMRGHLWKSKKDDNTWNQRLFVLSEAENVLCYYINEQDREPKQSFRLTDINVTFAEERTNKENSLQITCVTNGKTRNYFVHEDGKEIVDWYMAIRSAKLNILRQQEPYINVETLADHLTRDFTKEGFLQKRGPRGEPFQKRWFTLDLRRLLYFKRPMDAFAKGELIIGSQEEGFKVQEGVAHNHDKDEDYCFTLTTPERDYILKANTENERRMWMACLSEVISKPMTDEDKHEMKVTLEAATKSKGSSLRRLRKFSFPRDDDSP